MRARPEDLPELCACLLRDVQQRYNLPERRLSAEALAALSLRRWPGNVRELRHALAGAALNADGPSICQKICPRGGDFGSSPNALSAAYRDSQVPNDAGGWIGLRCARAYE